MSAPSDYHLAASLAGSTLRLQWTDVGSGQTVQFAQFADASELMALGAAVLEPLHRARHHGGGTADDSAALDRAARLLAERLLPDELRRRLDDVAGQACGGAVVVLRLSLDETLARLP
jgi:hypothetical protein